MPNTCVCVTSKQHNGHTNTQHNNQLYYYGLLLQGMVDGSASKPALRQDTGYMVEKTIVGTW